VIHSTNYTGKEVSCDRNNDAGHISNEVPNRLVREVKTDLLQEKNFTQLKT
jgi:hypothetical protein